MKKALPLFAFMLSSAAARTQAGGEARRDHSERREYDARGNLVRQLDYRRNETTGELEPYAVTYYTITYY